MKSLMIRTVDNTETIGENKIIVFEKENRKGNIVKKFNFDENYNIKFLFENLETKMIPKKEIDIINNVTIKILSTTLGTLIFQDFSGSCNFLLYNEDLDHIYTSLFEEIQEFDSIICYDEITEDYCIAEVKEIYMLEKTNIEQNNINLSNYILYTENNGIILNNILVIP